MSTYTPIATQTLGSAAASVTFSSIPQGYTDLVLVFNGGATAAADFQMQVNSDAAGNYSRTWLTGNGSSASSSRASSVGYMRFDQNGYLGTSLTNNIIINVMNYSNSTTYKTFLSRSNTAATGTDAIVNLWRSTNAISTIYCYADGTTFLAGSTFSIYGIQVGDKAQKAQGGNVVTSDGTYMYHAFTSSGFFIPNEALTVDYLVVAGGGGGAIANSGGAGAGGLRSTVTATGGGGSLESPLSLTAKPYPVLIGAGGVGGLSADGTQGGNSIFATITSLGGARAIQGSAGASGGSGSGAVSGSATGGAGTTNQGYAGGNSAEGVAAANAYNWGGGGGAGSVGVNGSLRNGGDGGAGVQITALATPTNTGVSGYYAGGGGGGYDNRGSGNTIGYGQAGGGNGSTALANATNAQVNTGSGGGGAGNGGGGTGYGGNGGSGIVIIRYAI